MTDGPSDWQRAALAVRLLLTGDRSLGGAVIRMRAGAARNALLEALAPLAPRTCHPAISREQLLGGLDLSATLSSGQFIENKGIFSTSPCIRLIMAERCPPDLAALLAQRLDQPDPPLLLALDEGAAPDEGTPPALADRLAFHVAPEGRMPSNWVAQIAPVPAGTASRPALSTDQIDLLTTLAARLGIDSLRAPLLAARAAQAHAALARRKAVEQADLEAAAAFVLAHRATQLPETDPPQEEDAPPPAPPDKDADDACDGPARDALPEGDLIVEAVRAALPDGLLAGLVPAGTGRGSGSGAGARRKGNRKGRPLPSRPGRLDAQHRLDLVATLRAAAPWQPLRRRTLALKDTDSAPHVPAGTGLQIRPSDFRVKCYEERSDRLLIFAVDASGSAALARLNEAKGAVETLLAQAYAARDHVALVAFRGDSADVLLPPTRSLVQTKKRLASLPGGGGTPLATGLEAALALAEQSRGRGLTPTVILLTDGRANISRDGTPDRAQAATDAEQMAHVLRGQNIGALVIDTAARPQDALRNLAALLGAPYLALPRADAQRLSGAVSAALNG